MEADFNRTLDTNSTFFFRHHPISANLLHRILTGQIVADETEAGGLIVQALMLDMTECLVEITESELATINQSRSDVDRLVATLAAFSKTYPDAGNIVAQAVNAYFQKRQTPHNKSLDASGGSSKTVMR